MAAEDDDYVRNLERAYTDAITELTQPSVKDRATELWLRPIRNSYALMSATMDKPIRELTMPEALAWFYCLTYAAGTGWLVGTIAARILAVILGVRSR